VVHIVRFLQGSFVRPVKELKGFEKIMLEVGETKTISFTIKPEMLQFYTANKTWEVEPGKFNVWVGGDSTTSLKETFSVIENK